MTELQRALLIFVLGGLVTLATVVMVLRSSGSFSIVHMSASAGLMRGSKVKSSSMAESSQTPARHAGPEPSGGRQQLTPSPGR